MKIIASRSPSDFDFTCPFCGKRASVHADDDDPEPAVAHEEPPCSEFSNLDPVAFMKACNEKVAASKRQT